MYSMNNKYKALVVLVKIIISFYCIVTDRIQTTTQRFFVISFLLFPPEPPTR